LEIGFKNVTAVLLFSLGTFLFGQTGPAMGAAPQALGEAQWSESGTADVAVPDAPQPAGPQKTITDIQIKGLKRTRNSYMQQILKKYKGLDADEIDLHDVETLLQAQGIFSESKVAIEDGENGSILMIEVKEKISFVPLPFFAVTDGSPMGGLFILDTNASGRKNMYVLGGIVSGEYFMALSAYNKPSLSLTQPGFSVSASGFKGDSRFANRRDEEVLTYSSLGFTASASILDKLSEHANASLGVKYQFRNFDDVEQIEDLDNLRTLSFNANYGQALTDWNGWFLSTKSASISAEYGHNFGSDSFQQVGIDILFQHPLLIDRLRIIAGGGAIKLYHPQLAFLVGGSTVGVSILPSDFFTDMAAGGAAGLELAVLKSKVMTLSVYGEYEIIRAESWKDENFTNQGFSCGAKMYLEKISFPAMAFGFSRNLTEKMTRVSFSLGVGM